MMRDWPSARSPGRLRQKQFEAFDLQAHFLPGRIVEGLEKRFDVLRLDVGHDAQSQRRAPLLRPANEGRRAGAAGRDRRR